MNIVDGVSLCKIMDYQKYIYEIRKKEKNSKGKSTTLKEIKFKNNIADHDLRIRARKATEMLEKGSKVKVSVEYRGRERKRIAEGKELIDRFINLLGTNIEFINKPKIEGNRYTALIEVGK